MFWRVTLSPPKPGDNPVVHYSPRFSTYGWRWCEVTNVMGAGKPRIDNIAGVSVHADVTTVGNWKSSVQQLNRIHDMTVNAIKANLQHTLSECCEVV